jgi:hypothetical protein
MRINHEHPENEALTHVVRRIEYSVSEQNRSQRLGLFLWFSLRLTEPEFWMVVVIWIPVGINPHITG